MAELKALKSTFMNLQKKENSFKLSERTVVDIISKIANRGKINLLHTVTGKEYVMDEKVNLEILNEIKRHKILSVLDLAKILEIPINIIEKKVNQLIQKNKTLTLVENKVLTDEFLNKMVIEINRELTKKGSATIAELANMFELSINFITQYLKQKTGLDKDIKGKLYSTRILTEEYIEMQKKKIRPFLIASISPINISTLITKYDIDEMLVSDIIDSMIHSGEIKGVFRANEYTSEIYTMSQSNYLKEELKQNYYLDYTKLKNIGISQNGKEYIAQLQETDELFRDGVLLTDYFISDILKSNFSFLLQENTDKGIPTNMTTAFFFIVEYEDALLLLDSLGLSMDSYYFINNNFVPRTIIPICIEGFNSVIKQIANDTYKQYISKVKDKDKEKKTESMSNTQKKGKKAKKAKDKQIIENEREDDIQLPQSSIEDLERKLKFNDRFDNTNEKEDTVSILYNKYILPKLNKQFNELVIHLIKSESNIAGDAKTLAVNIDTAYLYLKVIIKNLELLMNISNSDQFQNSIKAIMAYLSKKDLVNITKDLMLYQLIHMKLKVDTIKLNTHNERNDFINIYPDEDIRKVFITLNTYIQNRQVIEFINYLTEKCQILAVSLDPINKMKEKSQMEAIISSLNESVEAKIKVIQTLSVKEYTTLVVDICNLAISNKGFCVCLPNENWSISLYQSIFSEPYFNTKDSTGLLNQINQILSSKNFDYSAKEKDLITLAKQLYNSL